MNRPPDCRPDRPAARMGYPQWHAWAERKTRQGHRQSWCTVCQRYKFRGERCSRFKDGTEAYEREHGLEVQHGS